MAHERGYEAAGEHAVFVDTGAYVGLSVIRDSHHDEAVALFERLGRAQIHLVTTNFVVVETHALILARSGRDLAASVLSWIDASPPLKIRVSEDDERRAREIITRYRDKGFTLTDATSFAVMERLDINRAVAFDRHFARYGFHLVGAAP
ncbi:MAG: type II toxin-antitoxin system VapC family toxin [Thermomicrobiales bacterium]